MIIRSMLFVDKKSPGARPELSVDELERMFLPKWFGLGGSGMYLFGPGGFIDTREIYKKNVNIYSRD